MRHATGAMAVLAMCGPRAEEMAQKLAKGLLAEWKQASLAQKRGIWNAARTMPMGHERQACLKFMRMVEDGERQGDDMSAHTPGPWFVDPSEQRAPSDPFRLGGNRIFKVCMERGGLIADVSAWWVDTQSAEANAQLIAAAPELLAALRAIMAKRKRMGLGDDETHVTARAAIAKAEGRGTL